MQIQDRKLNDFFFVLPGSDESLLRNSNEIHSQWHNYAMPSGVICLLLRQVAKFAYGSSYIHIPHPAWGKVS